MQQTGKHLGETKVSVETRDVERVCKKEIVTHYRGPMMKQIRRNALKSGKNVAVSQTVFHKREECDES